MANEEHLAILKRGVKTWNQWRKANPSIQPDFNQANLTGMDLAFANLENAQLRNANLSEINLYDARLNSANLREADLRDSYLRKAKFVGASLNGAILYSAVLVGTDFTNADLENCNVYGISVWDIKLDGAKQNNIVVSPPKQTAITVDDLEIAQFIYLLLNNSKIRDVIDTMTGKAVLILGRFTPERKVILDALRDALRLRDYLPILFDFEKPASRDLTETIRTLASLSRFIIADLTDARSIPQELMAIVPTMPSLAVQSIIIKDQRPYAMYEHLERYPWVLPLHEYESQTSLMQELSEKVIQPAEQKANEQRPKPL